MLCTTCVLTVALTLQAVGEPAPAVEPPPEDRPISRFFQNLGNDIIALPSTDSALLIGTGAIAALAVHPKDDDVRMWADSLPPTGYTSVGSVLGNGWFQGGIAMAAYGVGAVTKHPTFSHVASDIVRAQALNAVVTRGMKLIADRDRPGGGGHSMPSGHASASFASAAVVDRHFGPRVGVPAYVAAGFIAWTRVRDNSHWLSDIIVGGTIGVAAGFTVTRGHQAKVWAIVPSVGPHQVAVHFVRVGP